MANDSNITNYCEVLVQEEFLRRKEKEDLASVDYIDVACVALNKLPPRYYRHTVDIIFYMPETELDALRKQVAEAVTLAIEFVQKHDKRAANS